MPLAETVGPTLFVVNLSNSTHRGSHWIGIYIDCKRIELFDTGGRSLINHHRHLADFRKFHSNKKFVFCSRRIQGILSDLCGEFVCLFALAKSKSITTRKFIGLFTSAAATNQNKNLEFNDFIVLDLFKRHFNCAKIFCTQLYRRIGKRQIQVCFNLRDSLNSV
jgi:hypothetical protein